MQRLPIALGILLGLAGASLAGDESKNTNAVAGTAGRKVFLDPQTGKILPGPVRAPQAAVPAGIENALSTSSQGLREVPGKARGGGIKVHLQGRFRSTAAATVGPDGKVTTRCSTKPETTQVSTP